MIFWPILYWSARAFEAECARLAALGHERINWRLSWCGVIRITWRDTPDPLRALKALPSLKRLDARLASTTFAILIANPSEGWGLAPKLRSGARLSPRSWKLFGMGLLRDWTAGGKKLEPG